MENTKLSETSELNEFVVKHSHYISEIRKSMVLVLLVFVVSSVVGFLFYESIIKFLINILSLKGINIVFTSPFQFINLAINCGIATGLIGVLPVLVYKILSFLKPALRKTEYKMLVRFIPFSFFLFLSGFLFGFFIMKWQIEIFLSRSVSLGIGNILDISSLISTVLITSVIMGIGFQFPVVLLALIRIGIVKHGQLSKQRLWIYLGSLFFAILLPPDSILVAVLLALPFVILFELVMISSRISSRRLDKKL